MYCVIQFYPQLRKPLQPHNPLLKVLAIKLVIFLSFWQTFLISLLTSTFDILKATSTVAYPDIKVGVPSPILGRYTLQVVKEGNIRPVWPLRTQISMTSVPSKVGL